MSPSATILRPLQNPEYRRLWAGRALSRIGDQMVPVALAVTVLKERHHAADLGFLLTAQSVAYMATVVYAGVISDRATRRTRVLLAGQLIGFAGAFAFAVTPASAPLPLLLLWAVPLGVAVAFDLPGFYGLIPRLVGADLVQPATALSTVTGRIAGIIGPALGGALVVASGPHLAFGVDAATYAGAAINLARIHETPVPQPDTHAPVWREAAEGFREVARRPWIAAIMVQGTVQLAIMAAPAQVLLPITLAHWGSLSAYGPLLAVQAAASAITGIAIAGWRPREPGVVAIGPIALVSLLFVCFAVHAPLAVVALALAVQGAVYMTFGVMWFGALQRAVPDRLLSRFLAVSELAEAVGEPVGLAATAPAVVLFGLGPVAWFCAGATVVTTAPVFAVPGVRDLADPAPADPPRTLEPMHSAGREA